MRRGVLLITVFIAGLIMLSSCIKKDSVSNEEEMKLLEQYLISKGITQDPTASGLYHIPIT